MIVDANVFLRDVKATYGGRQTALLGLSEDGYVRLLATDRVRDEVYRNIRRVGGDHTREVLAIWHERYEPLVRWVPTPSGNLTDGSELHGRVARVAERDATDAPTAELAVLCAPCLVATADKHLFEAGVGHREWVPALIALGELTDWDLGVFGMVQLTSLSAQGLAAIVRAAMRSKVVLPAAFIAVACIALWEREASAEAATRTRAAGRTTLLSIGSGAAKVLEERYRRLSGLLPYLVLPLERPTVRAALARRLAAAETPIPAAGLVEAIAATGFAEREIHTTLSNDPLFHGWPGQGWTLGRHLTTRSRVLDAGR